MTAENSFRKALIQLDIGKRDVAEANLRQAIEMATIEHDLNTGIAAKCCLGELLYASNRFDQAKPLLEEIVNLDRMDDVFDFEKQTAMALLRAIEESADL